MISSSQRASATVSTCSKVNSIMFLILVVVVCVVVGCFDDDAPFFRRGEVIAYSAGPQPASLRFLDFDNLFSPVSFLHVVFCELHAFAAIHLGCQVFVGSHAVSGVAESWNDVPPGSAGLRGGGRSYWGSFAVVEVDALE